MLKDAVLSVVTAERHRLWLIEDCAEALDSRYKGARVGSFGDAGAFSFYGSKTITTGEGGMVLFRDAEIADRARRLRDHGISPTRRLPAATGTRKSASTIG